MTDHLTIQYRGRGNRVLVRYAIDATRTERALIRSLYRAFRAKGDSPETAHRRTYATIRATGMMHRTIFNSAN